MKLLLKVHTQSFSRGNLNPYALCCKANGQTSWPLCRTHDDVLVLFKLCAIDPAPDASSGEEE